MANFPQPPAELPEFVKKAMREWADDPCYELDSIADPDSVVYGEDFIPYTGDLIAYQAACEKFWQERREWELEVYASKIGIPDNPKLAKHIMDLEARLDNLRADYTKLYDDYMQHDHAQKRRKWSWDND